MKTFRTTGTGNEQTLSEIETDKIPIYPSVQDIESDLANLEEGQIVATPDTGDEVAQPVDVVEKDNLHAVTSNAVSESLSYSTTEQKTGGVWIDGKPIYRLVKTDRLSVSANGETALITVSNNESFVRMEGFSYTTNGSANIPFNCLNGRLYYRTSDKTIMFNSTIPRENVAYTLILEYTKTTD